MMSAENSPVLLVPYMWIGDFVRCHSVVRVLNERWPERPVDVLADPVNAVLANYMPGVRKAIVYELPRRRLALRRQLALARRLRAEGYGAALIMSRKWKAALAPFLAGVPERTGYFGEARLGLLNDIRWNESQYGRMVHLCAALALPAGGALPPALPPPQLRVPSEEAADLRRRHLAPGSRRLAAIAPGSVAVSRRWPVEHYAALARGLRAKEIDVWILGGPNEAALAAEIVRASAGAARDFTGPNLADAVRALAAADIVISNDSGLLHVAAAVGAPTVGLFGASDPDLWGPINPIAAALKAPTALPCRPCHTPVCRMGHHLCMRDLRPEQVLRTIEPILAGEGLATRERISQ